jgi:hypothetical protein
MGVLEHFKVYFVGHCNGVNDGLVNTEEFLERNRGFVVGSLKALERVSL